MLICPSFFDGRLDGIGRVSGAFYQAMARMNGRAPFVMSSNDGRGSCPPELGRCFGRNYSLMLLRTLLLPSSVESTGVSNGVGVSGRDKILPSPASDLRTRPIVSTHLGLSPVARFAAARSGRPYVVFIHGVEAWRRLSRRSRWGISGADRLLFNSDYTRQTFLRFNPWAAGLRGVVVPLGLTLKENPSGAATGTDRFSLSPQGGNSQSPGTADRFRILIVGRMTKAEYYEGFRDATDLYKGFKQLIVAVGLLAREVPGVRLLIAGDGDARPDLEAWLAGRFERDLVVFLGRVSDQRLDQLYREVDVFALPSEGEGFGLVFVEAMAHGLPCVCVKAGAAPEVVQDGQTGLIARPRDVADLADKLFVLARNPLIRAKLGAAGRQSYTANFTAAAFEERIIAALGAMAHAQ